MTEAEIQKQIIEYLETSGCLVFRMNAGRGRNNQRLAPAGTPDLLAVSRKGQVWIEVKRPGEEPTTEQIAMHYLLMARNQKVIVATTIEEVQREI
jgi:Holliday junction resolvase